MPPGTWLSDTCPCRQEMGGGLVSAMPTSNSTREWEWAGCLPNSAICTPLPGTRPLSSMAAHMTAMWPGAAASDTYGCSCNSHVHTCGAHRCSSLGALGWHRGRRSWCGCPRLGKCPSSGRCTGHTQATWTCLAFLLRALVHVVNIAVSAPRDGGEARVGCTQALRSLVPGVQLMNGRGWLRTLWQRQQVALPS